MDAERIHEQRSWVLTTSMARQELEEAFQGKKNKQHLVVLRPESTECCYIAKEPPSRLSFIACRVDLEIQALREKGGSVRFVLSKALHLIVRPFQSRLDQCCPRP